jgi:hypothetical protein
MVSLQSEIPHSLAMISRYSNQKNETGFLAEQIDWKAIDEISRTKKLPSNIYNFFATSTAEMGLDLNDSSILYIIASTYLPHEMIQRLNRFRNQNLNGIICIPLHMYSNIESQISNGLAFIDAFNSSPDIGMKELLLKNQYKYFEKFSDDEEEEDKNKPNFPIVSYLNGTYQIRYDIFLFFLYCSDVYESLSKYNPDERLTFFGKDIISRNNYLEGIFQDYTNNLTFSYPDSNDTIEILIDTRKSNISLILEEIDKYCNIPLFKKEKNLIRDIIKPVCKNGSGSVKKASYKTAFDWIIDTGLYTVDKDCRSRIDGKLVRYWMIRKCDNLAH